MASPCFHAIPATPKALDAVSGVQTSRDGASTPLSFAAATAAGKPRLVPRFRPVDLPARQYTSIDGKPSIHFSKAEFDAGVALFKHSLIAKFTMRRPSTEEIRRVFKENWPVKGRATVSDIWDSRHLMIILDSEEDAMVALTSQLRKVGHAMFRLFRYSPDYNPRRESTTTTKWVRLPGLHPGFVTRNYVAGIVNSFGHFLDLDDRTKACSSLRFARACVEIDVSKSIPEEVRITLSDGRIFWQKIEIEGNLSFCSHCNIHGHTIADCWKKIPKNRDHSSLSADQETHIGGESKPSEINISNGHGYKGSTSTPHKTQEEWIQVKRKKGARTVSFQSVEGLKKHVSFVNITTAQAPPNVTVIGSQATNEAILDGGAVSVVNENKETGYALSQEDVVAKEVMDSDTSFLESGDKPDPSNGDALGEEIFDPSSAVVLYHDSQVVESSVPGGIDINTSNEELNEDMESTEEHVEVTHSSEVEISDEIAQKIASYDRYLFNGEKTGGLVDARTFFMHLRTEHEDDEIIFKIMDEANEEEDEPDKVLTDHEMIKSKKNKNRRPKNKKSRSSARACPKQKDTNFVWP